MIIFREIKDINSQLTGLKKKGKSIGFVPTMGALHDGHLSLVRSCKKASGVTVCSIFVNPTQFNDPKDFEKYPVTTSTDLQLLIKEETDILFLPSVEEVYPKDFTPQHYDLGYLETILEGEHRPGHFQGVCQVVHKLLNIIQPDKMFLGQKDYQQCMVLKQLVKSLKIPVEIIVGETLREPSGLAMSSRNLRLNEEQKEKATAIYHALSSIKHNINAKPIAELEKEAKAHLLSNGFHKVDYVSIADAATLQPIDPASKWNGTTPLVGLVAAFIGEVRLIDNMLLTGSR